jgi:magnesium-transporting ATPase (P-type)
MTNKSTRTNTKFRQTDRKISIIKGVLLSAILVATPFLFYMYKFAPADSNEWHTFFGTVESGGFNNVQIYVHAAITKLTFVLLTGIWFLTSKNWWKYAILVPFTMFLFQFSGVINYKIQYIDEFDFWYSLPIVMPILLFLVYISYRISKKSDNQSTLEKDVEDEIKKIWSDDL